MTSRRAFLVRAAAIAAAGAAERVLMLMPDRAGRANGAPEADLAAIERDVGGRLGVVALDARTGATLAHRADERFPMASTFKWLLAAQVLERVDRGEESRTRRVTFSEADLLDHAPVTRARVADGGLTVDGLLAAVIAASDNTAANLLLDAVGGPAAFTAFARRIGDRDTRLDRREPALNAAVPGDPRDTTTPRAMADSLRRCLDGDVLTVASRARLGGLMTGGSLGRSRLRGGLDGAWVLAGKTGSGANGTTNEVARMQRLRTVDGAPRPDGPPLFAAVYLTECEAPADRRQRALADAARVIAGWQAG